MGNDGEVGFCAFRANRRGPIERTGARGPAVIAVSRFGSRVSFENRYRHALSPPQTAFHHAGAAGPVLGSLCRGFHWGPDLGWETCWVHDMSLEGAWVEIVYEADGRRESRRPAPVGLGIGRLSPSVAMGLPRGGEDGGCAAIRNGEPLPGVRTGVLAKWRSSRRSGDGLLGPRGSRVWRCEAVVPTSGGGLRRGGLRAGEGEIGAWPMEGKKRHGSGDGLALFLIVMGFSLACIFGHMAITAEESSRGAVVIRVAMLRRSHGSDVLRRLDRFELPRVQIWTGVRRRVDMDPAYLTRSGTRISASLGVVRNERCFRFCCAVRWRCSYLGSSDVRNHSFGRAVVFEDRDTGTGDRYGFNRARMKFVKRRTLRGVATSGFPRARE